MKSRAKVTFLAFVTHLHVICNIELETVAKQTCAVRETLLVLLAAPNAVPPAAFRLGGAAAPDPVLVPVAARHGALRRLGPLRPTSVNLKQVPRVMKNL